LYVASTVSFCGREKEKEREIEREEKEKERERECVCVIGMLPAPSHLVVE